MPFLEDKMHYMLEKELLVLHEQQEYALEKLGKELDTVLEEFRDELIAKTKDMPALDPIYWTRAAKAFRPEADNVDFVPGKDFTEIIIYEDGGRESYRARSFNQLLEQLFTEAREESYQAGQDSVKEAMQKIIL